MFLPPLRVLFVCAALIGAGASLESRAAPAPPSFVGAWTIEQIPPGGTPRRQGTIVVTRNGNALTGIMRVDGNEVPLSDISENNGIISFSVPSQDELRVVLTYSGAIQGNTLGVASQDLGTGSYTLTAQRNRAGAQPQVAQAPRPAAPSAPAASLPPAPAAPPPSVGAPAQDDFVARLLGQTSPGAGPASTPAPPPNPPAVASAEPPAAPAPAARTAPPAPPPPPPSPDIEGTWSAEQTAPGGTGPSAATLSFMQAGDRVAGVLRSGGQEFPLFDVRQNGPEVTFSVVIPGTPYETVVYRGMVEADRMELAGLGEKQGAYNLTATRQGGTSAAASNVASSEPPPAPPPAAAPPPPPAPAPQVVPPPPAPQVALAPPPPPAPAPPPPPTPAPEIAPPPPAPQIALAPPPPPAPAPPPPAPPPPVAAATPDATLQGNWVAELTRPGSTTTTQASLSFDGDKATLRVGMEDLPLFDVTQVGHDIGFSVVVPGTPYMNVRYSGLVDEGMMQLSSLDEGRGVYTLQARRANEGGLPAVGPSAAQQASLAAPPPSVPPLPPVQARSPSPPSALPIIAPAAASSGPPVKLPLPMLRDLSPNDLAPTPLMGWSSRQTLGSRSDDAAIRQAVEGLVESGLNLLGYVYVEIGDGWQGARDTQGVLHPNERFPDMKALGDYIHSHGLKYGLTASAAPKSCNGMEGSYGREEQDARTFAEWGVDYVVYEWCGAETLHPTEPEMRAVFQKMGEALRASGRDIVYGISQKGQFNVEQWAPRTGANVWRTGNELEENWASVSKAGFEENGKEYASGPGKWNDPGLLQVGNVGMSADMSRMQVNLWSVLAAPLMLGNDVRIMTRETVSLLNNREVIAVNQDRLGRQGKRIAQTADTQVWAKELADGSIAVAFFNTSLRTTAVTVTWEQLGLSGPYLARDLWWRENLGIANNNYRVVLTGNTSMLLKFSKGNQAP